MSWSSTFQKTLPLCCNKRSHIRSARVVMVLTSTLLALNEVSQGKHRMGRYRSLRDRLVCPMDFPENSFRRWGLGKTFRNVQIISGGSKAQQELPGCYQSVTGLLSTPFKKLLYRNCFEGDILSSFLMQRRMYLFHHAVHLLIRLKKPRISNWSKLEWFNSQQRGNNQLYPRPSSNPLGLHPTGEKEYLD